MSLVHNNSNENLCTMHLILVNTLMEATKSRKNVCSFECIQCDIIVRGKEVQSSMLHINADITTYMYDAMSLESQLF